MYGDQVNFGFSSASSACYFSTKQTNFPRIAASTIMFYTVKPPVSFGNVFSDYSMIDRNDGKEKIFTWRKVPVEISILTKIKGAAKGALSYMSALQSTTRHYEASYNTGTFDLPLHNLDMNTARDLTFLENGAWNERIDADLYFNYKDEIVLGQTQGFIGVPSSVEDTHNRVDFDIYLK